MFHGTFQETWISSMTEVSILNVATVPMVVYLWMTQIMMISHWEWRQRAMDDESMGLDIPEM